MGCGRVARRHALGLPFRFPKRSLLRDPLINLPLFLGLPFGRMSTSRKNFLDHLVEYVAANLVITDGSNGCKQAIVEAEDNTRK